VFEFGISYLGKLLVKILKKERLLSYDESGGLHLPSLVESYDSYLSACEFSLAVLDFSDNFGRVRATEHRKFIHRPISIVVIARSHSRIQVYIAIL
jgi:hypothetical protein